MATETSTGPAGYTAKELMVAAAAREIKDGELVFVGMRLPLLAYLVARASHAPRAVGLFENGVIRNTPAEAPFVTMGDPPNVHGAMLCGSMTDTMGLLQAGRVAVGMIGGAEIDAYGNLNTTWVGDKDRPVRLPGSGGAADIASLAGRLVVIMAHEKRRFVERVGYVTSPGHGDGPGWRRRVGLIGGGPAAVVTDLCVLRFNQSTARAEVASLHPGVDLDTVRAKTGFRLEAGPNIPTTEPPTTEELKLIRSYDPQGFWTG